MVLSISLYLAKGGGTEWKRYTLFLYFANRGMGKGLKVLSLIRREIALCCANEV